MNLFSWAELRSDRYSTRVPADRYNIRVPHGDLTLTKHRVERVIYAFRVQRT
jgi:hypothetical protein